ncbi:hypothetical protein V1477_010794, partial [Vespula maculifrons]
MKRTGGRRTANEDEEEKKEADEEREEEEEEVKDFESSSFLLFGYFPLGPLRGIEKRKDDDGKTSRYFCRELARHETKKIESSCAFEKTSWMANNVEILKERRKQSKEGQPSYEDM